MSSTLKYSVSINSGVVDKPPADARAGLGKGWQPFELTPAELTDSIRRGHAYAPQFRGGNRKTGNFTCAGFLAADIDGGLTLDQAKSHAFVRHHAALIHTTVSHTAEHHRFRVVFLLESVITDARIWADAQLGLALRMVSDRSVSDGARMFFGNTNAEVYHLGKTIPADVVADLVVAGRDARASRTPDGSRLPTVSERRFSGPELIKLANGSMVRLDEIGLGERVHCPHHDDGDPSAFTLPYKGKVGIYCSACKLTFGADSGLDDYDFKAFDRLFEELCTNQQADDPDASGFDRFFPPAPRFERYQERFLPHIAYVPGITLVKSPKGSGKTEALRRMLDQIRSGQFRADIPRKDRARTVLLIGHRQALLREAATKLKIHCYLDTEDEADGSLRTLAVTLDSLPKYNESNGGSVRKAFDLVIIDESEQVLGHLFGKAIEKGRGLERCFDAMHFEIANAKAVIALDADLGLVTTHALRTMRPQDWASRCGIIYNSPVVPEQRRVMRLHSDIKFLEGQMIEAIRRGERCFIVSNSKKYVDVVHRMILNQCGDDIVMRVVTSDNSRDDATVRFLANIKTEFLVVQVVLGSPSIGTGIDITFENGACKVDRVFGFFKPFVNTHMDIDQQLCRVRNPGMVDIWISPATFTFTCNVEIIMDDLARGYVVKRAVNGRPRADGMVDYDRDDPLLMISAHVTALQRASKNRLIELFCELRKGNGWEVQGVYDTEPKSHYEVARRMVEAERKKMLLEAQPLGNDDYIELHNNLAKGASVTIEQRVQYERSHFERTVGVPLDADLVDLNTDGKLLERVVSLAAVVWICSTVNFDLPETLLEPTLQPKGRLQTMAPEWLIAVLVRVAGLADVNGLDVVRRVSLDSLLRFVSICQENRTVIEEVLGTVFRDDFVEKPVRQLNIFLRPVGLAVKEAKTEKIAGRKVRYYSIPPERLATMMSLSRSYLEAEAKREEERELRPKPRKVLAKPAKTLTVADETGLLAILKSN